MNNVRVRIKLGDAEFEAEGPQDLVERQLAQFQERAAARPSPAPAGGPPQPFSRPANAGLIFHNNNDRLSLRALPTLDREVARQTAYLMLILIYGYEDTLRQMEVPVTALGEDLRRSGLGSLKRLSNAFLILEKEGLALKTGKGKGTRYRLTNTGKSRAEELMTRFLQRANL